MAPIQQFHQLRWQYRWWYSHWQGATVVMALLTLTACGQLAPSAAIEDTMKGVPVAITTDRIQDIQVATRRDMPVQLQGKIGKRVPLLDGIVYELQDGTGTIWVLTQEPLPPSGDTVVIQGKLRQQTIQLNHRTQTSTYVEQEKQLQHVPQTTSQ